MAALASAGSDCNTRARGPASDGTNDHHSSTEEVLIGVGISRTATPANPDPVSNSPSAPGASSEKGPGTPGGGTGKPIWAVTASNSTPNHGLRSRGPQTAK